MKHRASLLLLAIALLTGVATLQEVQAQGPVQAPASAAAASASGFTVLQGRWVRPDGGYVITIRNIDADGKLEAGYANPNPLPFSRAESVRSGGVLRVFLELRAGGYNGSTYTLEYDPSNDTLKGVYFQAVAKQKFDVVFARAR